MMRTSATAPWSMSGNSKSRSSPGPSTARCAWSVPTFVRTSTVTGAVSSLQWVTRMPAPNGPFPQASGAGQAGSPSAFGGRATDEAIGAATGAGAGSNVRTRSAGAVLGAEPQATVVAAAAPTTIAHIPTCTRPPSRPSPTPVNYPLTGASITSSRYLSRVSITCCAMSTSRVLPSCESLRSISKACTSSTPKRSMMMPLAWPIRSRVERADSSCSP